MGRQHTGVLRNLTLIIRTLGHIRGHFRQSSWHLRPHRHVRGTPSLHILHLFPTIRYGILPFRPKLSFRIGL